MTAKPTGTMRQRMWRVGKAGALGGALGGAVIGLAFGFVAIPPLWPAAIAIMTPAVAAGVAGGGAAGMGAAALWERMFGTEDDPNGTEEEEPPAPDAA
ncbi:hypothetical protein [Streptomyces sp. DSM 40907]|uniref:hypothetical protein n=1 Tax=Streptomyces kutzneri TaxID=3051179 RepID=UPI0028D4EB2E|nr:hypothetical protein [Streptomyces sp. DSM 40907]